MNHHRACNDTKSGTDEGAGKSRSSQLWTRAPVEHTKSSWSLLGQLEEVVVCLLVHSGLSSSLSLIFGYCTFPPLSLLKKLLLTDRSSFITIRSQRVHSHPICCLPSPKSLCSYFVDFPHWVSCTESHKSGTLRSRNSPKLFVSN